MGSAPLAFFLHLTGFHFVFKALNLTHQEEESLLWMKPFIGAWQDHFSQQFRVCTLLAREVKKHHLQIPEEPPEMLQDIQGQGNVIPRQFSRMQHFVVPAQAQQTRVQRLSLKNKGALPYIS
jgi:hypothetical protein